MSRRGVPALVLLDRDGVINEDSAAFIKSVDEWRPIPGSLDAIAALHHAGCRIAVVTNQSGVARGLLSEATLRDINAHMLRVIRAAGGDLAGIYYCPHGPEEECECRKPRVGLVRRLERELGIGAAGVPLIGDKRSDVDLAVAVGARPVLVLTGGGTVTAAALQDRSVEIFPDLRAAAAALLAPGLSPI